MICPAQTPKAGHLCASDKLARLIMTLARIRICHGTLKVRTHNSLRAYEREHRVPLVATAGLAHLLELLNPIAENGGCAHRGRGRQGERLVDVVHR